MTQARDFESEQREWLALQTEAITTSLVGLTPSQWAEAKRYLPPSVTNLPGYYRFQVAPYIREILDCLSVDSPIREVVFMKGAQVCATVGVLENFLGYLIDHVKSAPVMLVTADAELAKLRLDSYIIPMLQDSGLMGLIRSADESNNRKTGKTDQKLEWDGGGFAILLGAQNANKLRSFPVRCLLRDEIDGWPLVVGRDGDPLKLSADRTAAFADSRKIADLSTPTIRGLSKIEDRYRQGDQRKYFVCCLSCGFPQVLRWRRTHPETGVVSGMVWETKDGILIPDSVRYLCENCNFAHFNDDKTRLLAPENGAEWRPTAVAISPFIRSYHLSALYSPVGMQTWATCVAKWLEAWDDERGVERDVGKLQVFYNNVLGESFEVHGERVSFETVSEHRRADYRFGEVPNRWAEEHCGGPVAVVTCAVDVHKDNLAVAIVGWCPGRRALLLDYWRFAGNPEQLDDAPTWGELAKLIDEKIYRADDGREYQIALTLIDSGYLPDRVYQFTNQWESAVFPIKGREAPAKNASVREFSEFTTDMGTRAYLVTVDVYKERWSAALKRRWSGLDLQPAGHFSAPLDARDEQLKELTREVKRPRVDKKTGRQIGFEWHRPGGSANELWDVLIYNSAALDLLAWDVCVNQLALDAVNWLEFFALAKNEKLFEAKKRE